MTDGELVNEVRAGNGDAFGELVDRHQGAVYRAALAALGNAADAEDIAQEALVLAYRRIDQFRGDASVRTWMVSIAWRWLHNRTAAPAEERMALQTRRFVQQLALPPGLDAAAPLPIIPRGGVKAPRALAADLGPAPLVEPLQMERLATSAIDVPAIEPTPTAIEAIELATLTVEPLATSNE
jgi:RNA polymerase sigma factor (sigma-70 family)